MPAINKVIPASGRGPGKDKSSYPMNVRETPKEVGFRASAQKRRMKNVTKAKMPNAVKGRSNPDVKVFKSRGFSFGSI